MRQVELTKHLEVALDIALNEPRGLAPPVDGSSLKIGILVQRLMRRVPRFWLEQPDSLAKRLTDHHPDLVAEIAEFDPHTLGFVVRAQLHIAAHRAIRDS